MKKIIFLFYIAIILVNCSDKKPVGDYSVIDVIGNIGKYQKVFCSELFSSIELVILETSDKCLIGESNSVVFLNDSLIIVKDIKSNLSGILTSPNRSGILVSNMNLYAFNRSGIFKNEIGKTGQGPSDYNSVGDVFINKDLFNIYVSDQTKILEYEFNGNFIRAFQRPEIENFFSNRFGYVGEKLFVGQINYSEKNKFKYFLFDQNGDTIKTFPNHIFFDKVDLDNIPFVDALNPIRVDNLLYLKDYVNDTLYALINKNLHPAYVFSFTDKFGYSYQQTLSSKNIIKIITLVGMPNHLFYQIQVPDIFPRPKSKPEYNSIINQYRQNDGFIYGIYDNKKNINTLLDTDEYFQKGFINDINGGLPFIPRYYAGNNIVTDVWNPYDMIEMLTEDYFSKQTIKDQQAHQKLKELLKILKEDDNPVVVVAKLK